MRFIRWSLAGVALLVLAGGLWGLWASGVTLKLEGYREGFFFVGFWLLLAWLLEHYRADSRLSALFYQIGILLAFCMLCYLWTYTTVALHNPLIDSYLDAADKRLGFDWQRLYAWFDAHPTVKLLSRRVYKSFVWQLMGLILWHAYEGRILRLWELSWLFWVSLFVCEIIARLWLSVGAFGYYHVNLSEPYVQAFMNLYNAPSGVAQVIGEGRGEGIIQFPSFHAVASVIYVYSARGTRYLFPFLLALNAAVLLVLLPIGGHFLCDMLAGVAVAIATILIFRHFVKEPGVPAPRLLV